MNLFLDFIKIFHKTPILESETLKILEKIEAETKAEVSKISMEQELLVKETSQKLEEIESFPPRKFLIYF